MYGRYSLDRLASMPALQSIAQGLLYVVPLAGGIVLLALAARPWTAAAAEVTTTAEASA
jgi:MFS transporter, PAT family, beta-lactamase induction signal transducer AmpG